MGVWPAQQWEENSLDSLNCCCPSPHHGPLNLQWKIEEGDVLVPERRQDYSSNYGTSPLGYDSPGATQLRIRVVVFGFLDAVWGGEGGEVDRPASPRGLQSLGQVPGYTTSWVQNFILKQITRIAKHRKSKQKRKMRFSRMFV